MTEAVPRPGEVWFADTGQPLGHEAGFDRPVLVVSAGRFNAFRLVTICPITSTEKLWPTRVRVEPGTTGLKSTSYVQAEQIRTISTERLFKHLGRVEDADMANVQRILRLLLDLR